MIVDHLTASWPAERHPVEPSESFQHQNDLLAPWGARFDGYAEDDRWINNYLFGQLVEEATVFMRKLNHQLVYHLKNSKVGVDEEQQMHRCK